MENIQSIIFISCLIAIRLLIRQGWLILFFLQITNLFGQKVTVSDEITLRNDLSYDLIGKIDSNFILFRDRNSKFETQVFDQNLRLLYEKEINLADKRSNILATLPDTNSFHVFYAFRDRGDYYVQRDEFDASCERLRSDTLKIFENVFLHPEIKFVRSEDKSKVLFFTKERDREMISWCLDLNTNTVLYDKQIHFTEGSYSEDFRSMVITNEGQMIMVSERNNYRSKKDKHFFEILKFPIENTLPELFEVNMKRMVSFHCRFVYDNKYHRLVGSGIYSQKNLSKAEGVYYIRHSLDQSKEFLLTSYLFENKLDEEIGRRAKDKNELNQLEISEIVLRQDGGVLIISEVKKEYERRSSYAEGRTIGARSGSSMVDYYYEDMVLFSVQPDGSMHWSDILHKKQYSHDDDGIYSSFFLFKNPSRLRLIFNDEISQENTVSEYIVQGNGQYQRKSVLSTEYVRLQLRFKDAVQISATAFVVPSQRSMRLNLVKIDYF